MAAMPVALAHSQGFYLKVGSGYSFPSAPQVLGSNMADITYRNTDPETGYYIPTISRSEKEVVGGHHTGVTTTLAAGYMFTSGLGIELSAGYLFGKEYTTTDEIRDYLDGELQNSRVSTMKWQSRNAFLSPAIVIARDFQRVRPYLSAGALLARPEVRETWEYLSDFQEEGSWTVVDKFDGGLSIGVRGTAGVDVKLGPKVAVFAEVAYTGFSFYPEERNTISYTFEGEDKLSTLTLPMRKTVFVKSYTYNSGTNVDPSERPSRLMRKSYGMNSLAATTGLKIGF